MISAYLAYMKSLIQIQQEYMDMVSASMDRWMHRRDGGHSGRARRGAFRRAYASLIKLGWDDRQARLAIKDAHDMMMLERNSD
jgi:hypothetical protein